MSTYWSGMGLQTPLLGVPISFSVTGVSCAANAGNIRAGISAVGSGSGVVATSSLGTVTLAIKSNVAVTGNSVVASVNSVSGAAIENPLAGGVEVIMAVGQLTVEIGTGTTVEVLGVSSNVYINTTTSWSDVPDSLVINWTPIE